jgi:integrase
MASIRKRFTTKGDPRYKAEITLNNGARRAKTFGTKAAAKAWAKRIEGDADMVASLGVVPKTFRQTLDAYFSEYTGKDTTQAGRLSWWLVTIGDKRLADIEPALIRDALATFARTHKPATVNRYKAAISGVFKFAINKGWLVINPCRAIPSLPMNNKIVRWLSDDERARLLDACERSEWPKMKLLILMAIGTGARKSELLNLRWHDIDFTRRVARLADTKNGKPRTLPLPKPVLDELHRWREVGAGLLFASTIKPDVPFEFRKHWDRLLVDAGIENFRFHDLRHTTASYLVMNGATLHEVAEVLGHQSVETTKRYAHLSTQHKAELAERVLGGVLS